MNQIKVFMYLSFHFWSALMQATHYTAVGTTWRVFKLHAGMKFFTVLLFIIIFLKSHFIILIQITYFDGIVSSKINTKLNCMPHAHKRCNRLLQHAKYLKILIFCATILNTTSTSCTTSYIVCGLHKTCKNLIDLLFL